MNPCINFGLFICLWSNSPNHMIDQGYVVLLIEKLLSFNHFLWILRDLIINFFLLQPWYLLFGYCSFNYKGMCLICSADLYSYDFSWIHVWQRKFYVVQFVYLHSLFCFLFVHLTICKLYDGLQSEKMLNSLCIRLRKMTCWIHSVWLSNVTIR